MHHLQEKLYQLVKVNKQLFAFLTFTANQGLWCLSIKQPNDQWISDALWESLEAKALKNAEYEALVKAKNLEILQESINHYKHRKVTTQFQSVQTYQLQNEQQLDLTVQTVIAKETPEAPEFLIGKVIKQQIIPTNKLVSPQHCSNTSPNASELQKLLITKANELEMLQKVVDQSSLVSVTDLKGNILSINARFCKVAKYSNHELIGKNHNIINSGYHPRSFWQNMWKTIAQGKVWKGDIKNKAKDGSYYWVSSMITPIFNEHGGFDRYMSIRQDITQRKHYADKLKAKNEALSHVTRLLEKTNTLAKLGAWELDPNTYKGEWSTTTQKIYEVDANFELTTENILNFYKGENREKVKKMIANCASFEEVVTEELKIVTAKNKELWVKIIGQGEFNQGQCKRIYGVVQDIDEQKKKEHEAKKLNTRLALATQAAQVGIWEYNIVDNTLTWDNAMFTLYGLTPSEAGETYNTWAKSLHPDDAARAEQEINWAIENKQDFDTEFRIVWGDGSIKHIRALAKVQYDDNGIPLFMIGTNWDITNEKLHSEMLTKARNQAEAANKSKSEFLANMSHEIRTPLNGVIGFADLLQRTKLNDTQQQYISTVYQSAVSLLDVISNILDFSKIESGKIELTKVKTDLLSLSQQIISLIRYQAHKKDLEVLLNIANYIPRFVWVDDVKVRQILVNLLGNAIKFTSEGEIELKIDLLEKISHEEVKLRFAVRDTGIGIAPKNKSKIFEAFSQEDSSTTRRFGGTGLGLSISNKLLGVMGSELLLESVVGRGSVFYFDLVLKIASDTVVGTGEWQNVDLIDSALIIDDNKNNRQILSEMLAIKNIKTEEVTNGLAALERLDKGNRYDVIFVDYHMPFMDGLETVKSIRQELKIDGQEQPIILFHSASDFDYFDDDIDTLDIQQQLVKPVSIEQLFDCLGQLQGTPESQLEEVTVDIEVQWGHKTIDMLVVEDNEVNMQLSKAIIQEVMPNVMIREAHDGQEAVQLCIERVPDIILMDVQMPRMNGYEATTRIREIDKLKDTPIIALTAGTLKGEKEKCLEAGMNDYTSKPIIKADFIEVINRWLNHNENMSNTEHFDQESLLKSIGNNPNVQERIYAKTKTYLASVILEIKTELNKQNFDAIKALGHTLKGASRSMYLNKLGDMAEALEGAKDLKPQELNDLIQAIEKEIDYIKTLI